MLASPRGSSRPRSRVSSISYDHRTLAPSPTPSIIMSSSGDSPSIIAALLRPVQLPADPRLRKRSPPRMDITPVSTTETWLRPKISAPKRPLTPSSPTKTSNKFRALNPEVTLPYVPSTSVGPAKPKKTRVPPVILSVDRQEQHSTVVKRLKNILGEFLFSLKIKNGTYAVQVQSVEAHRCLTAGLRNGQAVFHSFTLQEDRTCKTVIRGLPLVPAEEIAFAITQCGFNPISVSLLKGKSLEPRNPAFPVAMPAGTDMSYMSNSIKSLCHVRVTMEKFRGRSNIGGTQCYRCQLFGHSARNCNRDARCVKCLGQHESQACTRPKGDSSPGVKCCNCGGDHPANYRQCPKRIAYVKSIVARREATSAPKANPHKSAARAAVPNVLSYSGALAGPQVSACAATPAPTKPSLPTTLVEIINSLLDGEDGITKDDLSAIIESIRMSRAIRANPGMSLNDRLLRAESLLDKCGLASP